MEDYKIMTIYYIMTIHSIKIKSYNKKQLKKEILGYEKFKK